jgi:hypothetical protein
MVEMGRNLVDEVLKTSRTRGPARLVTIALAHRAGDTNRITWAGERRLAEDAGLNVRGGGWKRAWREAKASGEVISFNRRRENMTNLTYVVIGLTEAEIVELMTTQYDVKLRKRHGNRRVMDTDFAIKQELAERKAREAIARQQRYAKLQADRETRLSKRAKCGAEADICED